MNPRTNFFICSCIILAFSIINLHIGPTINGKIADCSLLNCKRMSDQLDEYKKAPSTTPEDIEKQEKEIRKCRNRKAMSGLENSVFIIDMGIGFICVILGLLAVQKEMIPKTGIIAMASGVIGFILTFIYVIFNGIVYTNYNDNAYIKNGIDNYKIDGDGAFAELEGDRYKCFYFKEKDDEDALVAKFSDLIKSQYNYNKELQDILKEENSELHNCNQIREPENCKENGYIDGKVTYKNSDQICSKLYYFSKPSDYKYFDASARCLACLILSLSISICHCVLAFCGFMLFKEP